MAMKTVWFWKGPKLNNNWFTVANYANDEHEKPSTVSGPSAPTDAKALSFTEVDEKENLVIRMDDDQFDGSPSLWYILEEIKFPTEMLALHAMTCNSFPEGTVVEIKNLDFSEISPKNRAGFIRWFRKDSRIQQIYTAEEWRRKRVSTKLLAAADIIIISGEFGPYLNGGDITTNDGEQLRQQWGHSSRVLPRVGTAQINN